MNSREKRFCAEYIVDYDPTAAAKRAGYGANRTSPEETERTAAKAGANLLKREDIRAEVVFQQKEQNAARCFSEKERVLKELWDVYNKATGAEEKRRWDSEGRAYWPVREYKYDGKTATKALELIAKMSGMLKEPPKAALSTPEKTEIAIRVVKADEN